MRQSTDGSFAGLSRQSPRLSWSRGLAAFCFVSALIPACSTPAPRSTRNTGALVVAATAYPLAQVVALIGGGNARVTELVPAGSNPFTFQPGSTQLADVRRSDLVVYSGTTVQPAFESVISAAPRKIDLADSVSETYFWLDPVAMRATVPAIEKAMEEADPADASAFRSGARDLEVELDSTAIDFQSTLSACPRRTVFMADDAFADLAKRYNLDYVAVGTSAPAGLATVDTDAAAVRSSGATAIFAETWVDDSAVSAVGSAARVKVLTLDTLLGAPPGGWPKQASYMNLLESNLGRLSDALGCATSTGP